MRRSITSSQDVQYFKVLGVRIDAVNLQLASEKIQDWITARRLTYVCVAPVSTVMDCQDDQEYFRIVNGAGMVTPDGMPIVWLGRKRAGPMVDRTYGPDLMIKLCSLSETQGYKHFFYGGSDLTNRLLVETLQRRFPRLDIVGQYAPEMLAIKQMENPEVVAKINSSKADILWVGLGSPKQDYWMAYHRQKIHIPVMIGAGAAFDFVAGTKPQAPWWLQRTGLEWLFRLCCEPRRLWKRYLVGNARFIMLLLMKESLFSKQRVVNQ